MTALLYLLGVLLFAVGVAASIGLHELGHLIPGKLFNVKVTQFFVGFGRTIWSQAEGRDRVRPQGDPARRLLQAGRDAPAGARPGPRPRSARRRTGMFAQLVSDARSAEWEHVEEADHDRLFYNKPWWKRVIIMGSGVAINLVLAFLLFAFVVHGLRRPHGHHHRRRRVRVRDRRDPGQPRPAAARVHAPRTRWPRRRRPASRPATGSSRSTAPASRAGSRCSTRSGPTATKTATVVVERDGREITLQPVDRGLAAARPGQPRAASPRSASSGWPRPRSASARAPATSSPRWPTAPGRRSDDRLDAGEGLPRGPGRPRARGARPQRPDERRRRRPGGRRGGLPGQGRRTATGSSRWCCCWPG